MSAYIFSCKGSTLSEVLANSTEEAYGKLAVQHSWIGADRYNSRLIRVVHITEPLGFDALLPVYYY